MHPEPYLCIRCHLPFERGDLVMPVEQVTRADYLVHTSKTSWYAHLSCPDA